MSRVFRGLIPYLTPPVIIGATFIIAMGVVAAVFLRSQATPAVTGSVVARGDITEEVSATGVVAPTKSIDMGFERGGIIALLPVKVGDHVQAGVLLAALDNADLSAAVEQAQANIAAAQAKLASLMAGTRPETLVTDRNTLSNAIQSAYIAADDAIHNQIDQLFNNPNTVSPTLSFITSNSQQQTDLISKRVNITAALDDLEANQEAATSADDATLLKDAQNSMADLGRVSVLLDDANATLSNAIPTTNVTAAIIAGYQSAVAAARTNIATALATLTSADGKLALDASGSTKEDIAAQQAAVASAQAALDAAKAQLARSTITAPISGTITRQDGNVGEVVAPSAPFISLNSDARFEINAYVSEADIVKLAVGNDAQIVLDAIPGVSFPATIVSLDPAATMQNGVPSYKVTAQFDKADPRIKAGLTANMTVAARTESQVLLVPSGAIITKGDKTYVLKMEQGGQVLTPVTIGIENANGETEITSGLQEGDRIASFGLNAGN